MDLTLPGSGRTVSQTFSVFDYDTGKYRYYTAPIAALPLTGHYRAPRNATPEGMAAALPVAARSAGEGAVPKGVIATSPDFHKSIGETSTAGESKAGWAFTYLLGAAAFVFILNQYAKDTAPPPPYRRSQASRRARA